MGKRQLDRRSFLGAAGATGLFLLPRSLEGATREPIVPAPPGTARNIIFLVVDGMNVGTWSIADYFAQRFRNRNSEWVRLYQEQAVTRGLMETHSANSMVTDSGAAGSSWASGQRINNGAINITPEGKALEPILVTARKNRKKTGLVTTTRISHATPATFATNVASRAQEEEIAVQYLDRGVDVLLGGGSRTFSVEGRSDDVDLVGRYRTAGYSVVGSREDLLAEKSDGSLLGTFWSSHFPYAIDREASTELKKQLPTLAEMMDVALDRLVSHPEGFILQVEGGRVDHAGHGNDTGAIVHEMLAFDECIAVARAFTAEHPDTLVILTTDHGTGGCQLNGVGSYYVDTNKSFEMIDKIGASYEGLQTLFGKGEDPDGFVSRVGDALQVEITEERLAELRASAASGVAYGVANLLKEWHGSFERTGVNWTSGNHTGELVEICSWGPGSERIGRYNRNFELNGVMRSALGFA